MNNDWVPLNQHRDRPKLSGVGDQVMHTSLGITKTISGHYDLWTRDILLPNGEVYEDGEPKYTAFPREDCLFRLDEKKLARYLENLSRMRVGDFVRCSGSRPRHKWRKVVSINEDRGTFVGQCAAKPFEDNLFPYMSENGIVTIVEIIRHGA